MPLRDSTGRRINYLRLSVTDKCNMCCLYCKPALPAHNPLNSIMTGDEITKLANCFASLGFTHVRITGGEPLLRPDIINIVEQLSKLPGIEEASMTTNGLRLAQNASDLAKAGLKRINISLDTLDSMKFQKITGSAKLDDVLKGIKTAINAGLNPVKLNVVIMRGMNDPEIPDFVAMTRYLPIHVRFIELMPVGNSNFFSKDRWVSLNEMQERAGKLHFLPTDSWPKGQGPATYYVAEPNAPGTIGFIAAISRKFCNNCNRVRLTSNGMLISCLDTETGVNLLSKLRSGASAEQINGIISQTITSKPVCHSMGKRLQTCYEQEQIKGMSRTMCQIGG